MNYGFAKEFTQLKKELEKLKINEISVQKGDVYDLDGSRVMCGDSTVEVDMLKLAGGAKIDMAMTDPPYILETQTRGGGHRLRGQKEPPLLRNRFSARQFYRALDGQRGQGAERKFLHYRL